jgi:hypothetical protein
MSFGLKISFGRFCKTLNITGLKFPIVSASGFIYKDYEEIIDHSGKKWFITSDGRSHDEIEVETEEAIYYFGPFDNLMADKKALCQITSC